MTFNLAQFNLTILIMSSLGMKMLTLTFQNVQLVHLSAAVQSTDRQPSEIGELRLN